MPIRTKEELLSEIAQLKELIERHEEIQATVQSSLKSILPAPEFHFESEGMEIYGHTNPEHDNPWRGDYLRFLDFQKEHHLEERIRFSLKSGHIEVANNLKKYFGRVGVLLADVSGHGDGEANYLTAMDGIFRTAFQVDFDLFGQVTPNAIERVNNVILNYREKSSRTRNADIELKYASLIYIEFLHKEGKMLLINAGHHDPLIFSYKNKGFEDDIGIGRFDGFTALGLQYLDTSPDKKLYTNTLGMKKRYSGQDYIFKGKNDLFIIYTDGVLELDDGENVLDPKVHLEPVFDRLKDESAKDIAQGIYEHIKTLGTITDDYTFVVAKRR